MFDQDRVHSFIHSFLKEFLPIVSLIAIVMLLQVPWSPAQKPLGVDSGFFAYVGRELLDGERLYVDIFDTKTPGIYYINSLALLLFGDTLWSIWMFQCIWVSITSSILFFVVRKWVHPFSAWVGTLFFLLTLHYPDYYVSGNLTEFYALLPQVLGLVAVGGFARTKNPGWLIMLGATTGMSMFFKLTYFGVGLAGALAVGFDTMVSNKGRHLAKFAFLVFVGLFIPVLFMLFFAAFQGYLQELWFSAFTFNLLYSQHGFSLRNLYGTLRKLVIVPPFSYLSALAVGGAGGFLALQVSTGYHEFAHTKSARNKINKEEDGRKSDLFWGCIFIGLLIEWILVFISGRFHGHYFITPLPMMAAGCAYLLDKIPDLIKGFQKGDTGSGAALLIVLVMCVAWWLEVVAKTLPTFEQLREIRAQYNQREIIYNPVVEYITQHTSLEESIFIWDDHPEYYFLSDRVSPTRFLYATQLLLPGNHVDEWYDELIRDLEEDPPVLIMTQSDSGARVPYLGGSEGVLCWMCAPGIEANVNRVNDFLFSNYYVADEIGRWVIYRLCGVQDPL